MFINQFFVNVILWMCSWDFPHNSVGKESAYNARICLWCRKPRFDSWVWKIPWRRKWQPTPVFLPGKFHGQRSLAGHVHGVARVRHNLATKPPNMFSGYGNTLSSDLLFNQQNYHSFLRYVVFPPKSTMYVCLCLQTSICSYFFNFFHW